MNRNKSFLYAESVLLIVLSVMLAAAVISIYREGAMLRASEPMADIYTVDGIVKKLMPILPVFVITVMITVINNLLGIRDEKADRAVLNIDIKRNIVTDDAHTRKIRNLRLFILVISVVCIIIGIFNGSMMDVFVKASNICTECIGLG